MRVVIYNIQKNYEGSSVKFKSSKCYHCTFNPLDKLMEVIEENKKYLTCELTIQTMQTKKRH